jgi:hypothetical protein
MYDNAPPSRLPQNMLSIFVATVVACSGYFVFAARFGDPARRAEKAVREFDKFEARLPAMLDTALRAREAQQDGSASDISRSVSQTLGELEQQVTVALEKASEAQATAESVRAENEALRAALAALQGQGALPVFPAINSAEPTTAPIDRPQAVDPGQAERPVIIQPAPVAPVPEGPVLSDRRSGVLLELLSAKVIDSGVKLTFTVTKETPGEGFIRVIAPRSNSNKSRILLDNGVTLTGGGVSLAGGSANGRSEDARLPSGIPVQFDMVVPTDLDAPLLCRLIEIDAALKAQWSDRVVFTLRDVVATAH